MNILYYIPVSEKTGQQTCDELLKLVSKEKQEQLKRFHFEIDRKLSLYSELLVRLIACKKFGINLRELVFDREEFGKPYLIGHTDFYYNISHTRNAVVVAIADFPVGVDIEKIGRAEHGIERRFFTSEERDYISAVVSETDKRFYEVWTKKEAYIKYLGKGLSMPLPSFNTLSFDIAVQILTLQKDEYIVSVCGRDVKAGFEMVDLTEQEVEEMSFSEMYPFRSN